MIYRRFGKTGLAMPVLSFGCMRSMHAWQDIAPHDIPDESQNLLSAILQSALAHGINHIETAHGYGSSERQLGRLLPHIPRRDYLLQTKVSPSEDPESFVNKVMLSMERLATARLDLLAIHGINDHRSLWYSCRKNGCLAAARRLQDRGLVDHIGFSGHGPTDVIMQALSHQEDGGFDFANIHWYYIFDANRPALELAAERDIGVFIISPSDKGGHLHTPADDLVRLCAPLSPMLFNDLYCLRQEGVCTIGIGASQPGHFAEHLKVLPFLGKTRTTPAEEIDARLRQEMSRQTGAPRPDAWWNLLPPWDEAPGNINLRLIIWLYNLYRGWGMQSYARARYAMLSTGSSWVPGNSGRNAEDLDFSELKAFDSVTPEEIQKLIIKAHSELRSAPGDKKAD